MFVTIVCAGVAPLLIGLGVWIGVEGTFLSAPLHAGLEVVGGCMAIGVALFLWLRLRDGTIARHYLWVLAALVMMGVMDGVHGVLPYGMAWSWTRYIATLLGGLLFLGVWIPVNETIWQKRRTLVASAGLLSLAGTGLVCHFASFFPNPFTPAGYTLWPKGVNAVGAVGFLGATLFLVRRYARYGQRDDLVFGGHTILFGVSGLLFSVSNVWGPEWWLWHGLRFVAYVIVVRAGYNAAGKLNLELQSRRELLEQQVEERTRALRQSEERYRALFNSIDEGFCVAEVIFDASNRAVDYRFIEINPAFVKQTGLANALGKRMRELAPRHEEYWFETYGRVALTGEPIRFQNEARQLDHWYDVFAFRVGQPEQRHVAILFLDITEQKRAQDAIARSEARLAAALRLAKLGTFEWNVRTNTVALSERSREIFGFSPGQGTQAAEVFERIDPRDLGRVQSEVEAALHHLRRLETEYRLRLPDGQQRTIVIMGIIEPGADGKAERAFGVFADITERKQREQRLSEQARLLDLSYDAIVMRDSQDRITYWNRGAEEIYGYSRSEALGRSVQELLQTQFSETMEVIRAKLQQEGRWSGELVHTRRDGVRIVVHSRWAVDRDAEGAMSSILETNNDITGRKRLVEALESSEARFRGLMEQAPFSVQVLDVDGGTVRVNKAWEDLWGITLEQLADYNVLQDPQLEEKGILPYLRKAFAGEWVRIPEIPYNPEETLPDRTRHEDPVRWVAAVAYPLKDGEGRVLEVVLVHEDVTDRRKAEAGLRESHALLRTAMDAGKLGTWDWSIQSNAVGWTEQVYEFYGLTPGTFAGTPQAFLELVYPNDRAGMERAIAEALAGRSSFEAEFRTTRPNGEVRWLATRAEVFRDADGKPLRMVGITQDVTDRKRFEEALQEREEQLRGTFENAAVGMALVDLKGGFLRINDALCRITGYSRMELLTKTVSDITFPDDLAADWAQAHRLLSGEQRTYSMEKRYVRKDESVVWVNLTVSLQRNGAGRAQNFISVVEDITERKRAEEALEAARKELQQQNQGLERVVSERTAKLREALAELEGYSYSIAHDMRAPLRGMQGFSKLLIEDFSHELSSEARHYLNRISNSAERLDRLIQDVLSYSRIVGGELQLEPVDPAPLLEEIIESYPHLQKVRDQLVVYKPLPVVLANHAALTQVFSNLLGNAIKFVAPGVEPRVVIRAEASGDKVRFWVEDNGIGIDPHAQKRIFQLFQRLHRPELYEGTGLGLAIVRKSVERMGGAVGVESEGGKGSRFWVELRSPGHECPLELAHSEGRFSS